MKIGSDNNTRKTSKNPARQIEHSTGGVSTSSSALGNSARSYDSRSRRSQAGLQNSNTDEYQPHKGYVSPEHREQIQNSLARGLARLSGSSVPATIDSDWLCQNAEQILDVAATIRRPSNPLHKEISFKTWAENSGNK